MCSSDLTRSSQRFASAPLGFAHHNIFTSNGALPQDYERSEARRLAFYDRLQQKLASLPGVTHAAVASTLPPYGLGLDTVDIEDRPVSENAKLHDVGSVAVAPEYFRLFEIPLRQGRIFNRHDQPQSDQVAIVNEAFAHEYFPDRGPIGRKIRVGDDREWLTVVGVVGNEQRPTVYEEMKWVAPPAVYRPMAQHSSDYFAIAVRSAGKQASIGHAMEAAVASIDSRAAQGDIDSM